MEKVEAYIADITNNNLNPPNEKHVQESLDKIRVIFEEVSSIIENLKPGERIPATKLAAIVAERHGTTGLYLYHTLKCLFNNYPGIKKTSGAHGGIERLQ